MSDGARRRKSSDSTARITVPAPSATKRSETGLESSAPESGIPQDRPTTVPDYDVEALAAASFHGVPRKKLPLDLSVPIRRTKASVCGAPLRAAFLLSHVDDRMTVAEIAMSAQIPVADAIDHFLLLADLGVVELRGLAVSDSAPSSDDGQTPPTKSGLRPKG